MSTGLYPGIGQPLYKASSNPQEPVFPNTQTIPSGSSSMGFPCNAGLTTSFNIRFGTVPSGTAVNVMYCDESTFSDEYALDTIAAVALTKVYTWSTNGMIELDGFLRLTNAGGQDITKSSIQQRATTVG